MPPTRKIKEAATHPNNHFMPTKQSLIDGLAAATTLIVFSFCILFFFYTLGSELESGPVVPPTSITPAHAPYALLHDDPLPQDQEPQAPANRAALDLLARVKQ